MYRNYNQHIQDTVISENTDAKLWGMSIRIEFVGLDLWALYVKYVSYFALPVIKWRVHNFVVKNFQFVHNISCNPLAQILHTITFTKIVW